MTDAQLREAILLRLNQLVPPANSITVGQLAEDIGVKWQEAAQGLATHVFQNEQWTVSVGPIYEATTGGVDDDDELELVDEDDDFVADDDDELELDFDDDDEPQSASF